MKETDASVNKVDYKEEEKKNVMKRRIWMLLRSSNKLYICFSRKYFLSKYIETILSISSLNWRRIVGVCVFSILNSNQVS